MYTVISTLSHAYNDFYKKQWYIVIFTLNAELRLWAPHGSAMFVLYRWNARGKGRHCSLWHSHRLPHLLPLFTVVQGQTATFIAIAHCDTGTDCHIYRYCSLWHSHSLPNAVFSAVFKRLSNVDFYHTRSPVTARRKCCESIFHFSLNLFLLKCNNHLKLSFALIGQKTLFRHDKILSVLQCL